MAFRSYVILEMPQIQPKYLALVLKCSHPPESCRADHPKIHREERWDPSALQLDQRPLLHLLFRPPRLSHQSLPPAEAENRCFLSNWECDSRNHEIVFMAYGCLWGSRCSDNPMWILVVFPCSLVMTWTVCCGHKFWSRPPFGSIGQTTDARSYKLWLYNQVSSTSSHFLACMSIFLLFLYQRRILPTLNFNFSIFFKKQHPISSVKT